MKVSSPSFFPIRLHLISSETSAASFQKAPKPNAALRTGDPAHFGTESQGCILIPMIKSYLFLAASIVLNAGSYIFYKQSSQNAGRQVLATLLLVAGLVIGAANATLYTKSLQRISLNTAYPIFSAASLILITIISVLVFGEAISFRKILGIVVLTVGVVLVTI